MNRKRKPLLILGMCAATLISAGIASAQDFNAHYERYLYHRLGQSARSAAMGGVYAALQGGEMGLKGNPASLGFLDERYVELDFEFEDVESDTSLLGSPWLSTAETEIWSVGGGIAYPFEWGGLALEYNYREDDMDSEWVPVLGGSTLGMAEADLERHNVSLGGGYRVNDQWGVGLRYGYYTWERDNLMHIRSQAAPLSVSDEFEGHKAQFGSQYVFSDDLTFGIDGSYGIGDREFDGGPDSDADSWDVRGGAAWRAFQDIPLLLALDLSFEKYELDDGGRDTEDEIFGVHLGVEYEMIENLFVRAGYQWEDYDYEDKVANIASDPSISGYSVGFGYQYEQFSLDYGIMFIDTASQDLAHVVGLGFRF